MRNKRKPNEFSHCNLAQVKPFPLLQECDPSDTTLPIYLHNGGVILQQLLGLTCFGKLYEQSIAIHLSYLTATERFMINGIA